MLQEQLPSAHEKGQLVDTCPAPLVLGGPFWGVIYTGSLRVPRCPLCRFSSCPGLPTPLPHVLPGIHPRINYLNLNPCLGVCTGGTQTKMREEASSPILTFNARAATSW